MAVRGRVARGNVHPTLAAQRLCTQGLLAPRFDAPEDVVAWLGAVQAQDWYGSLWAVGSRMRRADDASVQAAIDDGRIVRTWPMRGTLHFVAPADARWMTQLLAPRSVAAVRALIARHFGLDDATLRRCRRVLEKALRDGRPMARSEVYAALDAAGIDSGHGRGTHITGWLAQHALLCGGPRIGRQPSFVWMDAWVPPTPPMARDEALHALGLRYFRSHGPATVQDLAWWSGLTVKDAQLAAELARGALGTSEIDGRIFFHDADTSDEGPPASASKSLLLLAPFDEYLVGYRDRSAAVEPEHARRVIGINGLFNASVLSAGRVAGTWKRIARKDDVLLQVSAFRDLGRGESAALTRQAKRYAAFLGFGRGMVETRVETLPPEADSKRSTRKRTPAR